MMEDAVNEYLFSLQLGDVQNTDGVKLSDDAKMLIFLNPGLINQLAAEVQDLSRPAIFVVYDRKLVKVRSTKMNYDAIRPDGPTIAIEHQATGEQPVHVTPEGVQAGNLPGAPSHDQQHIRIDWFPYDAVKPREGGHYLITARYDGGLIVTTDDFYSYGWDDWGGDVIAWAELPEPYKEGE